MQSGSRKRPTRQIDKLAAAVARAEEIPADRPLTTDEIRMLDTLTAQLRRQSLNNRTEALLDLLRRASLARTRKRGADVPTAAEAAAAGKNSAKKRKRSIGDLHRELSELAAERPLQGESLGRLHEIVSETASLAQKGPSYARLHERALQIQERALRPAPQKGSAAKSPNGLVQNPELLYGGREVLGGAPGSRRRH